VDYALQELYETKRLYLNNPERSRDMKKYHVLLIAALATLGLSACDRDKSPDEGTPPATEESSMVDSIERSADDAIKTMEDTMDKASDSMSEMMDEMAADTDGNPSEEIEE